MLGKYIIFRDALVSKSDVKFQCLLPTALQVVVPFGVALPLVKKESRHGRRRRTPDRRPDYEHPAYGIRLARLDHYFSQLEVRYTVTYKGLELGAGIAQSVYGNQ
jgi:hypothetical protein